MFEGKLFDVNIFRVGFFPLTDAGWRNKEERGLWPRYFLFVFVLENADHLCLSDAFLMQPLFSFLIVNALSFPQSSLNNFLVPFQKLLNPSLNLSS